MKRTFSYIVVIILCLLAVSACSQSRKNEVIYKFSQDVDTICVDSLKAHLLDTQGLEMLVMYPDSDIIIIHYDRFRTHHEIIENHFSACGYSYELLKKSPLEEVR